MLNRLLTLHEELTDKRLRVVYEREGCCMFVKVRVADVSRIENSGIANELYSFGLRAHADFTITDCHRQPLFVVEFDGPQHQAGVQARRDRFKDQICTHASLPLLRITARYLPRSYRGLEWLTWILER
jgi:Protein of unknown function (DUF2726)